jgi:hypothetical protein
MNQTSDRRVLVSRRADREITLRTLRRAETLRRTAGNTPACPLKLTWPGRPPARAPSIRELMPDVNINPGTAVVRPPGNQDQDSVLIICKPHTRAIIRDHPPDHDHGAPGA